MILPAILLGVAGVVALARLGSHRVERATALRRPVGAGGIIEGAEGFVLRGTGPDAVLLLHGCGDTPQSLRYLGEALHSSGFTVSAPLLPGHGRTLRAFDASCADDWLGAARAELESLRAVHRHVGIAGLSMGGAIATVLAADMPDLPALVLIAPYFAMPAGVQRLARTHRLWRPVAPFVPSADERSVRDAEERARNLGYGACSGRVLSELLRVVQLAKEALPRVTTPALVIHSREDNRIAAAVAAVAYARLGSRVKRLEWVEGTGHVLTVDLGRERVIGWAVDWFASHLGSAGVRTA